MVGSPGYRGRGPRLGLLDHDCGGGSSRRGLPGHHSEHPPGRGHPLAGPSPPPPRQGHGPTAPGGVPLPPAAARHRWAPDLPGGTHPGGPGTPPGGLVLAGTASAGARRSAASGATGVGGPPTPLGQAPRARLGVCGIRAGGRARQAGPARLPPPSQHGASGEGPGDAPGGGQGPRPGVARLARGVLVLGSGGRIPLAKGRVLRPPWPASSLGRTAEPRPTWRRWMASCMTPRAPSTAGMRRTQSRTQWPSCAGTAATCGGSP